MLIRAIVLLFFISSPAFAQWSAVRNDSAATTVISANGSPGPMSVDSTGKLFTSITSIVPGTGATNLGKAEDSVHATGDTGVATWGVGTATPTSALCAAGDYCPMSTTTGGVSWVAPTGGTNGFFAVRGEDTGSADSDFLNTTSAVRRNSAASSAGSDTDFSTINNDADGRLYVNPYGAGAGEFFQACSSAATGTSDTAIKAAVASNRMYITHIGCSNTAAVASAISIKDGTTIIDIGGVGTQAATGGDFERSYIVPLRGTVNTALNFAMTTTATATTCCATGYISTN